jgi:hypothetical protein
MAGSSVTITKKRIGDVQKVKLVWVSDDATGAVSGTTTFETCGQLMRLTTVPAAGGSAPTDNYDLTIKDEDGLDILNGLGADRSATVTQHKVSNDGLLFTVATTLTLAVANAGNAKGGTVYLYFLNTWAEPE